MYIQECHIQGKVIAMQGWLLRRCLTQINRICGRKYRPKDLPIRKLRQVAGVTWPDPLPRTSSSSREFENDTEIDEEDEEQFESEEETEDEEIPHTGSRMFKFHNAMQIKIIAGLSYYIICFLADHLSGREDVEPPPLPEPPRVEVSATSCTPRRDTATLEDLASPNPVETASASVASLVTPEPKGIGCEH